MELKLTSLLCIALYLLGSANAADPRPAMREKVEQILADFASLNPAALAQHFTKDGVFLWAVSGNPPLVGQIAIYDWFSMFLGQCSYWGGQYTDLKFSGKLNKEAAVSFTYYSAAEIEECRVQWVQQHTIQFVSSTNLKILRYDNFFDHLYVNQQLYPSQCKNGSVVIPPVWPNQFVANFTVLVENHGPQWTSTGRLIYDWTRQTQRADYWNWCLPQTETPSPYSNHSCSYIIKDTTTYYINYTSPTTQTCCILSVGNRDRASRTYLCKWNEI